MFRYLCVDILGLLGSDPNFATVCSAVPEGVG
jgi:hypothetical protein